MGPFYRSPSSHRASGFTLIEIVVVILILAIVIAMASALTRGVSAAQKRTLTATRMATVDAALVQFVSQQKRLPCPADGTLPSSDNSAGVEGPRTGAGCTGTLQNGVVPWRALGLTETDATDGWDRRLTYRLDPLLGADNGMNMSACDPAGTEAPPTPATGRACTVVGCTSSTLSQCTPPFAFLAAKGLMVKNLAGIVLMNPAANPHTGAAYVVISPGESGGGGFLNSGQLSTTSAGGGTGDGTEEATRNYASSTYVATPGVTYYVDDSLSEAAGATHFDDVVLRPSVMSAVSKAGLGPRAH